MVIGDPILDFGFWILDFGFRELHRICDPV
jgi:hypothetical protein